MKKAFRTLLSLEQMEKLKRVLNKKASLKIFSQNVFAKCLIVVKLHNVKSFKPFLHVQFCEH